MHRRLLVPLLTLIFLVIVVASYFRYPSHSRYMVRGLDISHHQGKISWERIPTDVVDFVYIKASEGGDFLDREFSYNWKMADTMGVARGAYHFFTFCTSGREQAEHFVATVGKSHGELPPAVDIEYSGNCSLRLSDGDLKKELDAFNSVVREAWGVETVYYAPREIYSKYPHSFEGHKVWGRAIMTPPSRYYNDQWVLWQFSSFGRVAGIEGPVDQNVFHGSKAEFKLWIESKTE